MLQEYQNKIPDYAKDLKLNLSSVLTSNNSDLTESQVAGIALACAYATFDEDLIHVTSDFARDKLNEAEHKAVKAATSIMAMNNVYYRFIHLAEDNDYQMMPANLRMSVMANPGIDKKDFELFSLAVSAINGCGMCISSHSNVLVKSGISKTAIQHAVRIAAVIHGLAQVAAIEKIHH
ncbi:MAG: alkyl hydroperoxide reductase [Coxiella sp. RIFCSPHIGHO2_12_FULL_42_15]|nr:MAG: alkyl hydroperoxide reductase [Coxiella sp. RIFCSPHIGHO2_12_FULL_42_15]